MFLLCWKFQKCRPLFGDYFYSCNNTITAKSLTKIKIDFTYYKFCFKQYVSILNIILIQNECKKKKKCKEMFEKYSVVCSFVINMVNKITRLNVLKS